MHRVLVVEDENDISQLVRLHLEDIGCAVTQAFDGIVGLAQAQAQPYDLIILDLKLPGLDGLEVCRRLRAQGRYTPILMLTSKSSELDRVLGLEMGADDYLTKPFSPRELVARVRVMLRRPRSTGAGATATAEEPPRTFGPLAIDVAAREVAVDGRPVEVTRTEFDLLAALSARPRMAFSRRQLIDAVWGEGWVGDEHLVDVHIGHLRRKLGDDPAAPRYLRTVRGVGYRMGEG
jgi:DNA-binding response OmpR family regulator